VNSEKTLRCLRIEDFGTHGLQGADFDMEANFFLLGRAEFKTSSVPGRGGSYGLGKQVLWKTSAIATTLLSSAVEGWEAKGIRIFGRTDIPSHKLRGVGYQSGGWLGEKKKHSGTDRTFFAESIFGNKKLGPPLLRPWLERQRMGSMCRSRTGVLKSLEGRPLSRCLCRGPMAITELSSTSESTTCEPN
jgi:hypothetical protein